jgi:predicted PurR-regulated permease PerM
METTTTVVISVAITLATTILGFCVTSIIIMSRKIKESIKNINHIQDLIQDTHKDISKLEENTINRIENLLKLIDNAVKK